FGQMQISRGTAFIIDSDAIRQAGISVDEEVPVGKEWVTTPDFSRHFLVESVELATVAPLLSTLPTAAVKTPNDKTKRLASANGGAVGTPRPTFPASAGRAHLSQRAALSRPEFLASLPRRAPRSNTPRKFRLAQAQAANRQSAFANRKSQ